MTLRDYAVTGLFRALHEHLSHERLGQVRLGMLDEQSDLFVTLNGGPPDLVIEVLSPKPRIGDTDERVAWFRDHGVRECWLVHQTTGRVEVLHFKNSRVWLRTEHARKERIESGVLPQFDRSLAAILGYGG